MQHECGILALYNVPHPAQKAFYGLYALQHRGQEGCGIFVSDEREIRGHKSFGMVRQVFHDEIIEQLEATCPQHAIAQVRYASASSNLASNLQPIRYQHLRASFALCSNGCLINQDALMLELQEKGAIFQSSSNCEVLAHLLVQNQEKFLPALKASLNRLVGSYCFAILRRDKIYAVRDPLGMMPLSLGKLGDGWVLASETCAFELLGADYVRDIEPGEILEIRREGLFSHRFAEKRKHAVCAMEYIYFARPDSSIDQISVHQSRFNAGVELAKEAWVPSDIVMGVPESAISAAHGYAAEAGIPFDSGLLKNKYSGRSFIESSQERRDLAVYLKLSPIRSSIEGRRITLVDDSIVRGTTSRQLVQMVKKAGAKEVHLRIASPVMIAPCFYGVDTSDYDQLIGSRHSVEEIRQQIGADSLAFLSLSGLRRAIGTDLCDACFSEHYPTSLGPYQKLVDDERSERKKHSFLARDVKAAQ